MTIPSTSKAVIQPSPHSTHPELTTLPVPSPSSSECLIQVRARAPCLGERLWESHFPTMFKDRKARVPGTEGAGIVVSAPPTSNFRQGDEVMWRSNAWMWGSAREYTAILEENLALKPASLSWTEAAATPLSALTAWDGVFTHGPLDAAGITEPEARKENGNVRVLVTGASGSVGRWAVRLASLAGASVIAVGGGDAASAVLADGAKKYLDYRRDDLAALPEKVQHVFDCTGKDTEKAWSVLEDNGTFVSVCVDPNATKPKDKPVKHAAWFLVEPSGKNLAKISEVIEKQGWKPMIDSVVRFEQAQEAFDKADSGRVRGKVVITVTEGLS